MSDMGLDHASRRSRFAIPSVGRARRFDQQNVCLFFCHWTVLDTLGDDKQLAWTKRHVVLAHSDGNLPLEHEKEVIGLVVRVPDELALDLDHHQVMSVKLTDRSGLPVL